MKKIIAFVFINVNLLLFSQSNLRLQLTPKVETNQITLNQIVNVHGKKVLLDHFNYYLSNLHVFYDGNQDLDLSDTVFLVKANNFILDLGTHTVQNIEKITFGVGVPQNLNHLDISIYRDNHPLGFQTPSMHWGWAAGYMHMIIGGTADSNEDQTPDAYFELHNLGDVNYHQVEVLVSELNLVENQKDIYVDCNIDTWLSSINLGTVDIKHGETDENMTVMSNLLSFPVFTSSTNATISEQAKNSGQVSFFVSNDELNLNWSDIFGAENMLITDLQGKIIFNKKQIGIQGSQILKLQNRGIYFVNFYSEAGKLLNQTKLNF
jgi:hypothetical protein